MQSKPIENLLIIEDQVNFYMKIILCKSNGKFSDAQSAFLRTQERELYQQLKYDFTSSIENQAVWISTEHLLDVLRKQEDSVDIRLNFVNKKLWLVSLYQIRRIVLLMLDYARVTLWYTDDYF